MPKIATCKRKLNVTCLIIANGGGMWKKFFFIIFSFMSKKHIGKMRLKIVVNHKNKLETLVIISFYKIKRYFNQKIIIGSWWEQEQKKKTKERR